MWDFLQPTRLKLWISLILWGSYWLIGKLHIGAAMAVVSILYPGYFLKMGEKLMSQSASFMQVMDKDTMAAIGIFSVVHVAVTAIVGYVCACLIVFLVTNRKSI